MSINMDSSSGFEYADHEVQTIGITETNEGEAENSFETKVEPVSERGIDNDELAELVYMRRIGGVFLIGGQAGEEQVNAEAGLGLNLSGDSENPTQLATNATIFENGDVFLGESTDPGTLDTFMYSAVPPQSVGTTMEREVNFRETFGSGPYVDKTDDITIYTETESSAGADSDDFKLELVYQLYWNVEEMPEGRASFSRP